MYDIKPLEEDWQKYNKKKRLPIYISFFTLLILLASLSYFLTRESKTKIYIPKTLVTNEVNNSNLISKNDTVLNNDSNEKLIKNEMNNDAPTDIIVENIPILEEERKDSVKEVLVKKSYKKIKMNIIESSSLDAYKEVEKRFYESRDIDDSLFLAKSYYRQGKYKKSEFWALQTNKINSTIDGSWIIFAQSKNKMGHKNEAINILNNYIKRTNSEQAKNILLKIKNNK